MLYVVRHAMVTVRTDTLPEHWHLSLEGRAGAAALAEDPCWARVALVYTSPEPKAVATAQRIAAPHSLTIAIERDLREIDGRTWIEPGRHRELALQYLAGEGVDGWEVRTAALDRMRSALAAIVQRRTDQDVAVVSHGLVLTLWLTELLDLDARASHELWKRIRFPDLAIVDPKTRRIERGFGG